jgi:hypothetical protein
MEDKMRDPNEPSINDCGAPWNEGDDGECECSRCNRRRRKMIADEIAIDREDIDELFFRR